MAEFKQIISDALDILKFDGAVQDTLAELREKWGAQVPALLDERFDAIGIQYMKLPHEKGAAALGQELSAFGWALYNLDDEDEYEPIPEIQKWLEQYPVPARLAPEVTEIEMDGGSEIYTQLCPFWDGEDGAFDLNTITEDELRQFPISPRWRTMIPSCRHITMPNEKVSKRALCRF